MNAKDVLASLRRRYSPPEWLLFDELRTTYRATAKPKVRGSNGDSFIDAFAVRCWRSRGREYEAVAFEIKVSRSDLLAELKQPEKREPAMAVSNRFYFVCPEGVARQHEIPADCGLLVVLSSGRVVTAIEAPYRHKMEPTWEFLTHIARRALMGDGRRNILEYAKEVVVSG